MRKTAFFRIFLHKQNKKLDRNAPLRSLVLRAEIDSFPSCLLKKKGAGRAGRTRISRTYSNEQPSVAKNTFVKDWI